MRDIELPPYAPLLMESTRAIGYSLEAAIADILDNSIAANASRISIRYNPYDNPYIAIIDNGIGMNENELKNSMRYGCYDSTLSRGEKDLGRFGLGMKTASLSQCRRLTVVSKKYNKINACRWDLDYIRSTGKWSLILMEESEILDLPLLECLENQETGTITIWQNLDKISNDLKSFENEMIEKMEEVRNHLSLVFHRYLSGEKGIRAISIDINNNSLVPIDPFLIGKSNQIFHEEELRIGDEKVIVTPYLLPHISNLTPHEIEILGGKEGLRKNQGFYIYRNKRLLVWGNWFKLAKQDELSKLARIKVDIPNTLDSEWTLDIKKSTATPPYAIRKNLASITKKICESSKLTWNFRGKREVTNEIVHLWNRYQSREGIFYEINKEHPIVKEIIKNSNDEKVIEAIGKYLPLNQIFSDLNHDKKINYSEKNTEEKEIRAYLDNLKENFDKEGVKKQFKYLIDVEPFCNQKEIIYEYLNEWR